MKAARLNSPRLQRVLRLLSDRQSYSSFEITLGARVVAVSTTIAELRANGADIECEVRQENGKRRWYYTMLKAPVDG